MSLNEAFSFDSCEDAIRFARARAKTYQDDGMEVDHFNGHDWVWYARDLTDGSDKGILLQLFHNSKVEGGILAA